MAERTYNCNETVNEIVSLTDDRNKNGFILKQVELLENGIPIQTFTPTNDAERVNLPISYNSGTNKTYVLNYTTDCQYYEVSLQFRKNDLERSYTLTKKPFSLEPIAMLGTTNASLQYKLNSGSFVDENAFKTTILSAVAGDVITVKVTDTTINDVQVRLRFKVQTLVVNPFTAPAITIPIKAIDSDLLVGFTEKIISFAVATSQATELSFGLRTDTSTIQNYTDYPYSTIPTLLTAIAALPANTNYAIHIHWRYTVAANFGGTITLTTGFANGYKTQKVATIPSTQTSLYRGVTHKAVFAGTNGLAIRRWQQFEHNQSFTVLAIHEGDFPFLWTRNNGTRHTNFGINIYPIIYSLFNLPQTTPVSHQTAAYSEARFYLNSVAISNKLTCTIITFDGSITPRTSATFPAGSFQDAKFFSDRKLFATVPSADGSIAYPFNEFQPTTIINPAWANEASYAAYGAYNNNTFNATPKYAANECDALIGCFRNDASVTTAPNLGASSGNFMPYYNYIASIVGGITGSLARLQVINKAITPTQAGICHNSGDLGTVASNPEFLLNATATATGFVDSSSNTYQIVDVLANSGVTGSTLRITGSINTNTGFVTI
jgi:hypothetical protein